MGIALLAGCNAVDGGADTFKINSANELGITSISTQDYVENGDPIFELRAFADGTEIGVLRHRVGAIAELTPVDESGTFGSEVTLAGLGTDNRWLTREVEHIQLPSVQPELEGLFQLTEVSTALREHHLFVADRSIDPGADRAYATSSCPYYYMNSSPTARQCCYGNRETVHLGTVASADTLVHRQQNYYGTGCKASDGTSSCSGSSCYYGPNGFARPTMEAKPSPVTVWRVDTYSNTVCTAFVRNPSDPPIFGDVYGSFNTNQGCPGGATGAGQWDY